MDAALFALLAIDGEHPRDRLAAWLWPEAPLTRANVNLRQRLFKLRQVCGHPLVQAAATLRLAAGVQVDGLATSAVLEGELLGGFDYGDHEALDTWVLAARASLARVRVDHWAGQAARLEAQGAWAAAIALCERIVSQAPWCEHVWRRLMRLHYLRGDRAAAIAAFERLERHMRDELGAKPSDETQQLLQTVEHLGAARLPEQGPLPASLVRPPVLVGRDQALRTMGTAWRSGHAVLVLGEGGIGKSRLIADFTAGRLGVVALRARPGDAAMPYATMTQALRDAIERFAPELPLVVRHELARLLPAMGPTPRNAGRQASLWQAVESTLAACIAQGMAVLVVDDLHFADLASLELLRWLLAAPALASLRQCFAARPDEPEPATPLLRDWAGDSNRLALVRLAALGLGDVQRLIDTLGLAALREAGPGLAELLYRHAGGHPFYTLETVKAWVLAGSAPLAGLLPMPPAAHTMIEHRLARLSPPARDLLRLAAVAGAELLLDVAAQVLRQPLLRVAEVWAELESAQVMQGAGFAHDLVRECALGLVPIAARPALHRALAQALQRRGGVDPAQLAQHGWAAEDWPAAARGWRDAAAAARRSGRLAEAEDLLARAAQACRQAGDAAGEFDALCESLASAMLRQGSQTALERLHLLEPLATQDDQRARLLNLQVEALLNLARYADALAPAEQALRLAGAGSATASDANSLLGQALALNGQTAPAIERLLAAVQAASVLGDEARQAVAVAALAHARHAGGQWGQAVVEQQRAVALAQRIGDPAELATAIANLATLAYFSGDACIGYHSAKDAEQRLAALQADGNQRLFNRIILARCAAHRGQLGQAWQALHLAAQPGATDAGGTSQSMARIALAGLLHCLGRPVDVDVDLPMPQQDLHPLAHAGLLLARARLLRASGHDAGASLRALEALEALGEKHPALREDPALCLDWSRYGAPADALQRLHQARQRSEAAGAEGLARSLAVRQVDRLRETDPAAAAKQARWLRAELPKGLHPSTYPPEAWCVLADALQASAAKAAAACRREACRWIEAATLPEPSADFRPAFLANNRVNQSAMTGSRRDIETRLLP